MDLTHLSSLIAERQSPSNRAYFATRGLQCFSAADGPSWLDILLGPAASKTPDELNSVADGNTTRSPLFPPEPASNSILTLKAETDSELQQILDVSTLTDASIIPADISNIGTESYWCD